MIRCCSLYTNSDKLSKMRHFVFSRRGVQLYTLQIYDPCWKASFISLKTSIFWKSRLDHSFCTSQRHAPIQFLESLSKVYFLQDTNPSLWWNLFSSSQVQGTETASTLLWWNSSSLLFVLSFSSVFLRHFIKDWTSTQSSPARQTRTRNTPMIRVLSRSVSSDSVSPSTLSARSPGCENVDNL